MNLKAVKLLLLIIWEYLKRNFQWAAFILLVVFIFAGVQIKFNLFYAPDVVKIGLIGTYQEHDLPEEVTKLVSTSLVEAGKDGKIWPKSVTGWEVNDDATRFKFKLKEIYFSNHTKVKSSDLEFAIPNTTITYPDNSTIQFDLKEPYSPLPSLLTKPFFKKGTLLGTGPYKISKTEKSRIFITKITLRAEDPSLPTIYIRFYPNEKVAVTGFNLGEVQVLAGVTNPSLFASNPLINLKAQTNYSKIVTILFQTTDPLLRSRSLRQALAYQTPKIVGFETANNPYPANFWAYDPDAKKYLSSPKEAREALERAKSQLPEDKLRGEIILTTTPSLGEIGKNIIASWKQLDFDAKIRIESGIPQNFQALLITQNVPADPDQYSLWHATQTKTNLTKYDSKRVDKDLEDGRKIITEQERKAKYYDFQKTLLEDAPAVFLYFPKQTIIYLRKAESALERIQKIW